MARTKVIHHLIARTARMATLGLLALGVTCSVSQLIALPGASAMAQALVMTVNDSPVTNYDVEQRMRLLRVLRMPASRDAAIESLIRDRLILNEVRKYSINPSEQEITQEAVRDANERKISPQQLSAGLQSGRIDKAHWQDHWRASYSWKVLIAAFNKQVSVSEDEVRAEVARTRGSSAQAEYRLQQITLIVPASAGAAAFNSRFAEANQLRARFRGCEAGIKLARTLRDVAVQPAFSRQASSLSDQLVKILNSTPVGQLTSPGRGPTGVDMIAVCGKSNEANSHSASELARERLLARKLKGEYDRRLAELRAKAVIVKRR